MFGRKKFPAENNPPKKSEPPKSEMADTLFCFVHKTVTIVYGCS